MFFFEKESFGWLLLHKHSFCLLSQHDLVYFQKRCHTCFPAEYFLGLICRLGTRMNPIFPTISQKPIFNSVEHLQWSFLCENSEQLKAVKCFRKKKSTLDVRPGSKYASVSNH